MEKRIWDFLKAEGFNDFGIAGLMGNLFAESRLLPNNIEDKYQSKLGYNDESYTCAVDNNTYTNFVKDAVGYGLAQWTYWTRKQNLLNFARQNNKSIGDLDMQLHFLVKELKESYTNSVYNVLKKATSVLEASNAVLLNFERPVNISASVQATRAKYGQTYYDRYALYASSNKSEVKGMIEFEKGRSDKISKNFQYKEFDCHGQGCCSTTIIDEKLVEYVQQIRDHFGKPVTITSPYRCEVHNRRVGGATKSYHMRGQAADIVVQGVSSREVAKYAESIGILGIGLYETSKDGYFTHIDTRTTKSFWYGQSGQPRTTFGGTPTTPTPSTPTTSIPTLQPTEPSTYHKSSNKYAVKLLYLQKGDIGRDVQILQELLKIRGYNIETSGKFDTLTYNAVVDFQKKTKIGADGIVGSQTMEKLLTV